MKVGVTGCNGRMGVALIQAILSNKNIKLGAATVSPGNPLVNMDVGLIAGTPLLSLRPVDDLEKVMENFEVLIDFTSPQSTLAHLQLCQRYGKKIVIGTTGFNAEQKTLISEMSRDVAIVQSANMSVGINLCMELLTKIAATMGENADIEIIEAHHRHKVDAPSGTALQMGEIISQALHRSLESCAVYSREGITGVRDKNSIGFSSIRAGDIIGDHTVIFASDGERMEITHKATSRSTFAIGALRAAQWLFSQREGLYDMRDVLFGQEFPLTS